MGWQRGVNLRDGLLKTYSREQSRNLPIGLSALPNKPHKKET